VEFAIGRFPDGKPLYAERDSAGMTEEGVGAVKEMVFGVNIVAGDEPSTTADTAANMQMPEAIDEGRECKAKSKARKKSKGRKSAEASAKEAKGAGHGAGDDNEMSDDAEHGNGDDELPDLVLGYRGSIYSVRIQENCH